jgi:UbiD family decarboxylase
LPDDEEGAMNLANSNEAALDLRVFLDRLKGTNELRVISGAHWDLEIGALTEMFAEQPAPPALLFDDIPGYPRGRRVISNILFTPHREALALGLAPGMRGMEIVQWMQQRLEHLKGIPPQEVKDAPVMENILLGDDVNVLEFPAPKWHANDGGRYIGTFDAVICRDPDTGYVNIGTYRVEVHDEKTIGVWIVPGKHGDLIARKYWAKGEPCPFLVACGLPPSFILASAVGIPWTQSEYDFLGGLLNEPVPVVSGQLTGLPMPARAEIVFEGFAPPPEEQSHPEGPFGEWPGYYASERLPAPVINVKAIYHRNDPIITGEPPLKTYLNGQVHKYMRAANIWSTLQRAGVPDVKGVWFPRQGRFVVAVSINQRFTGHAREAAYGVLATRDGGRDTRMVIVVDEDIDITNTDELLWAVSTRWDPKIDSETVQVAASGLNPRLSPENRARNELMSSCIIIDACRPYHWKNDFPIVSAFTSEEKNKYAEKWAHLFK